MQPRIQIDFCFAAMALAGYCTVNEAGLILQINRTAATAERLPTAVAFTKKVFKAYKSSAYIGDAIHSPNAHRT